MSRAIILLTLLLSGCGFFERAYVCNNQDKELYNDTVSLVMSPKEIIVGANIMKRCKKQGNVVSFVPAGVECEGVDSNAGSYKRYRFDDVSKELSVTHVYVVYDRKSADGTKWIGDERIAGGFSYNCRNAN